MVVKGSREKWPGRGGGKMALGEGRGSGGVISY